MGELLNLVGLSAGVALYAMLLAMVSARRRPGAPLIRCCSARRAGPDLEPMRVTGLRAPQGRHLRSVPVLVALGFSALGFLPAVVVHSVLRGQRKRVRSGPAVAGRCLRGERDRRVPACGRGWPAQRAVGLGMRLLTYTFLVLVPLLAAATRGQPGSRRALWVAALAIFAVSALHLSQLHRAMPRGPWSCSVITPRCRSRSPSCIRTSIRARRPVPEAGADAAGAARARVLGVPCSADIRPARGSTA